MVASHVFRMAKNRSLHTHCVLMEVRSRLMIKHGRVQKVKSGRPKTAEAKVLKHNLTVRLCDTDLLLLDKKARQAGLSYSSFLRQAGLSRVLPQPVPEINLTTYQELGRIGSNINQLLKLIYEGKFTEKFSVEMLSELTQIIRVIRNEVRGA